MMKKVMVLFVSMLVLGFGFDVFAQEYKVGDKMPDFRDGTELNDQVFGRMGHESDCDIAVQRYLKNGKPKYQVAFPGHNFGILPFGIYDMEINVAFIDNKDANGKNEPDGLIDEIVKNPEERDVSDHPYCNKK